MLQRKHPQMVDFRYNQIMAESHQSTLQRMAILSGVPIFAGLTVAEMEKTTAAAQIRRVDGGAYFFLQGDPADRLYILLAGRLKMTQLSVDGQQVIMQLLGPGSLFGAVALAQVETYPVSAEAAESCEAACWRKIDLMNLVLAIPRLGLNAMQMMANHVQDFQERFRQLATERVERRLAHALLRLAAQTGTKIPEGVLINMPLSRQDLAEMTGTTLFTVSRILKQWEGEGLVILGREKVIIRYPHGLVSIAEDLPRPGGETAG